LQVMYQVLVDSLCIVGSGSPFKFDRDTRSQYADEILNQQSNVLLGVGEQESCEHENDGTCLLFNPFTNLSGILHPERVAFGWRWIAFICS